MDWSNIRHLCCFFFAIYSIVQFKNQSGDDDDVGGIGPDVGGGERFCCWEVGGNFLFDEMPTERTAELNCSALLCSPPPGNTRRYPILPHSSPP